MLWCSLLMSVFFFFHHHFCVWLQLSFIFPEGLSLLCHATRFSTVCVLLITAMWTWALVVGNVPTSGYRKKKFWSFLVKVNFSVCGGVGLESFPGDSLLSGVVQCIDSCCWREYCSCLMSVFCIFIECKIFCYESHRCKQEPMINRFQ